MGLQTPSEFQACGYPFPVDFLTLLVSTLVKDNAGNILGFNFTMASARSCGCYPVVDCDHNHLPPETLLVDGFGIDACGNLAIKLVNCDGTYVTNE